MSDDKTPAPEPARSWWDYYAHVGVVVTLFLYFSALLTWLIRAFLTGGTPERIMTTVVIPLLLFILTTIATVLIVIIREGKKQPD